MDFLSPEFLIPILIGGGGFLPNIIVALAKVLNSQAVRKPLGFFLRNSGKAASAFCNKLPWLKGKWNQLENELQSFLTWFVGELFVGLDSDDKGGG